MGENTEKFIAKLDELDRDNRPKGLIIYDRISWAIMFIVITFLIYTWMHAPKITLDAYNVKYGIETGQIRVECVNNGTGILLHPTENFTVNNFLAQQIIREKENKTNGT